MPNQQRNTKNNNKTQTQKPQQRTVTKKYVKKILSAVARPPIQAREMRRQGPLAMRALGAVRQPSAQMSNCAMAYLAALTDPHSVIGHLPCIPDAIAQPSFKISARSRFEFVIGQTGVGGVAVWPMRLLANDDLVQGGNSFSKIMGTTAAYNSNSAAYATVASFPTATPPAGVTNYTATTSLFRQVDFQSPVNRSARLVGSGIRVGYTGPVTSQKGTVTFMRNPLNTNVLTTSIDDLNEILTNQDAVRINVRDMRDDNSNGVAYRPLSLADLATVTTPTGVVPLGDATSVASRLGYIVHVTGGQPGDVYTGDVVAFFETYGTSLPLTQSDSDQAGAGAAQAAVSGQPLTATPQTVFAQAARRAAQILGSSSGPSVRRALDAAAPIFIPAVQGAIASAGGSARLAGRAIAFTR